MKYWMPIILVACIATILIAGCASTQSAAASTSAPSVPTEAALSTGSWMSQSSSAQDRAVTPVPTYGSVPSPGTDTKIIKTASVTIETANVSGAANALAGIATGAGGYVSSTSVSTGYNDRLTGSVTIRVPADRFDSTLSGVQSLGKVTYLDTQSEDVTSEYIDTQARINAYKNQIAQYNTIMKNATDVKDVLAVQQQIDTVQTELDQATGQMKYLTSRINYSTISVNLQEPEPVGGRGGHDFVSAINNGIAGFFGVIDGIIVLVLSLLPVIIIGGAAYAGYRVWKRRQPVAAPPKEPEKKE